MFCCQIPTTTRQQVVGSRYVTSVDNVCYNYYNYTVAEYVLLYVALMGWVRVVSVDVACSSCSSLHTGPTIYNYRNIRQILVGAYTDREKERDVIFDRRTWV